MRHRSIFPIRRRHDGATSRTGQHSPATGSGGPSRQGKRDQNTYFRRVLYPGVWSAGHLFGTGPTAVSGRRGREYVALGKLSNTTTRGSPLLMRGAKSRHETPANREARDIDTHVGAQIRRRRMFAGLAQQEVAKALGVSFQQVQKYESSANRISAGRLFILARVLGTDLIEFYEGLDGEPNQIEDLSTADLKRAETFMRSREGLRLNLAFLAIKNPVMRKHMLDLIAATNESSQE